MRAILALPALLIGLGCGPIVIVEEEASSQGSGGGVAGSGGTSGTTSETMPGPPEPETLATAVTGIALALDGTYLYFSSEYALWKMPKAGGDKQKVASGLDETPQGIAVDGTHIYWQSYTGKAIFRASLDGGPAELVASGLVAYPQWVTLDDTRVYFPTDGTPSGVLSVPKAGGQVQAHATGGDPNHVAVDATHVYWAGQEGAHRVAKAGGGAETLSAMAGSLRGVAVDGVDVFLANPSTGSIYRVSKLGGPEVEIASGEKFPSVDALDEGHVYWTSQAEKGRVARAPKAGGPIEVLAEGQTKPFGLVIDGSHVYWIATLDETIRRVALP
jgi:hypothetical protein